jgi:hypothetical protein
VPEKQRPRPTGIFFLDRVELFAGAPGVEGLLNEKLGG